MDQGRVICTYTSSLQSACRAKVCQRRSRYGTLFWTLGCIWLIQLLFTISMALRGDGSGWYPVWNFGEGSHGFQYVYSEPDPPIARGQPYAVAEGFAMNAVMGLFLFFFVAPQETFVKPWVLLKGYKRRDIECGISFDFFTFKYPHFWSESEWSLFRGFYEDANGFLLMSTVSKPIWIPKDGFQSTEDIDYCRAILRQKVGPYIPGTKAGPL